MGVGWGSNGREGTPTWGLAARAHGVLQETVPTPYGCGPPARGASPGFDLLWSEVTPRVLTALNSSWHTRCQVGFLGERAGQGQEETMWSGGALY